MTMERRLLRLRGLLAVERLWEERRIGPVEHSCCEGPGVCQRKANPNDGEARGDSQCQERTLRSSRYRSELAVVPRDEKERT